MVDADGCKEQGVVDFNFLKMVKVSVHLDFPVDELSWYVECNTRDKALMPEWEVMEDFPVCHHGQWVILIRKGVHIQVEVSHTFSDALLLSTAERQGHAW